MMSVACMRGIYVKLEQPRASMLMDTPQFQFAASLTGARPVVTFLGAFGSPSPKPVQIWTNGQSSDVFKRSKKASDQRLGAKKVKLAVDQARRTASTRPDGSRKGWKADRWVGGKKSRQGPSEQYPLEFCHAMALAVISRLSDESKAASSLA